MLRYMMHPGQWEELHIVKHGESLSAIAAHYAKLGWRDIGPHEWQPIYRLTRQRTGLWRDQAKKVQLDNPNLIHPGDLLVIPRSRSGYVEATRRIHQLLQDAKNAPLYSQSVKTQTEKFSKKLDLVGSALTFLATASLSAMKAVKSAKLAEHVVGPAAREFLKDKGLASASMGLKIAEYGAWTTGNEKIESLAHSAEKVVHVADLLHGSAGSLSEGEELLKKREFWRLGGEGLGQVVDAIDVAAEWTDPSTISKGMLRLFTGVDVDATIDQAMDAEKQSRARLIQMLHKKISKLQEEKHLIYG